MFGLENKGIVDFKFGLEKELKGPNGAQRIADLKQHISKQIEDLKGLLRKVDNKDEFQKTEMLLHGFMSLQKVLEKSIKK